MADLYASSFQQDTFPTTFLPGGTGPNRICAIAGRYAVVAAAVAINDKLHMAQLPSDVRILFSSTIYFDALGSGAADVDIGDDENPDGLTDAEDMTSAGSGSIIQSVDLPNRGKMLWEMLGYSADPGGLIDIYATFKAEPAANGDIYFEIYYLHP